MSGHRALSQLLKKLGYDRAQRGAIYRGENPWPAPTSRRVRAEYSVTLTPPSELEQRLNRRTIARWLGGK